MAEGRDFRGGTGRGGGEIGRGGRRCTLRQSSGASLWIRRWSGLLFGFLGGGGGDRLVGRGGRGNGVPGRRGGEGGGQVSSYSVRDLFKKGTEDGFQDGHWEKGEVVVEAEGMEQIDEVSSYLHIEIPDGVGWCSGGES